MDSRSSSWGQGASYANGPDGQLPRMSASIWDFMEGDRVE